MQQRHLKSPGIFGQQLPGLTHALDGTRNVSGNMFARPNTCSLNTIDTSFAEMCNGTANMPRQPNDSRNRADLVSASRNYAIRAPAPLMCTGTTGHSKRRAHLAEPEP